MSTNEFQTVFSRNDAKHVQALEQLVDKNAPVSEILKGTVHVPWLTVAERKGLLEGPKADVYVGQTLAFRAAPVRALMAWSPQANAHFRAEPLSRKVVFSESKVTAWGIAAVLKATVTNHGMGGEFLASVRIGGSFINMVKIYQAGNVLDMSDRVFHVFLHMQHLIDNNLLGYDQISAVVNAVEPDDGLFHHLARDLANRRFKKLIPDPITFAKYLDETPALKKAMDDIDAPHKAGRKAVRDAIKQAKVANANRIYEAEQKRLDKEYRASVAALVNKVNSAQGGILTLSAEEAELKRELGI